MNVTNKILVSALLMFGLAACSDNDSGAKSHLDNAKEKTGGAMESMQKTAADTMKMAQDKASSAYDAVKDKTQGMVDDAKEVASDTIKQKLDETIEGAKDKLMGEAEDQALEETKDAVVGEAEEKMSSLME